MHIKADFKLKVVLAFILTAGGLWVHELVQAVPSDPLQFDPAIEQHIPFLPWTIWIYFSFFLFIGSTVFRVEERLFWQFVASATLAAFTAWTIVMLFPITFDRPDSATIANDIHRHVYAFVHAADPHHITFPSLHVAVTWICNFLLWNRPGRGWRVALGLGISVSTLTTKQHMLWDVLGGMVLAWLCVWLTGRFISSRSQHS